MEVSHGLRHPVKNLKWHVLYSLRVLLFPLISNFLQTSAELENMRACIAAGNVKVTEEEIAKYNLGTSLQTSGDEDEDEEE